MEISARDKKLLVYLIAVSIIAGSYFFVAKPLLDKQAKLNEEISELQQKVTHYTEIYNNMDNYESQIAEAQTKYNETCNKLFGGLNQDNTIMMVKDLENATDVWIARLSFTEEDVVFGEEIADANAEGDVAADATGEVATNDATEAATDDGGEAAPASIQGVRQDLNIDYAASYDNFKRFIEYIENHDERLFISSINATYSVDSGLVGGSMVLSQYAILGTDKEYKAPEINNVTLGTDTIFKTGTTLLAPDSEEGLTSQTLSNENTNEAESENSTENESDNEAESESNNNSGNNEAQSDNNSGSSGSTPSKPNGPAGGII
ncbi:MAG: hypothetical protein PUE89_01390 [Lachnospiraceae bacterium]|nr:hypothetical protein [Lachnospiraceae bacterium]